MDARRGPVKQIVLKQNLVKQHRPHLVQRSFILSAWLSGPRRPARVQPATPHAAVVRTVARTRLTIQIAKREVFGTAGVSPTAKRLRSSKPSTRRWCVTVRALLGYLARYVCSLCNEVAGEPPAHSFRIV